MSVPRHAVQGPSDLDTTAELPVLDVAAYEATQEQPPEQAREQTPQRVEEQREPYHGRLEEDLKALSASLCEFEQRLAAQGKRSSSLESELDSARGAHAAAEQRANGLSQELTQARGALSAAEAQIHELLQLLESREAALRSVDKRDAELAARVTQSEQALARAQLQLHGAQRQASARLEALQSREARRGVLDALFRELDGKASRHEGQVAELQHGLTSGTERARALQVELEGSRRQSEELAARVQSLESALAAKDEQLASLTRASEELRQSVRALTESGTASAERLTALELDAQAQAEAHARELAAANARQRELETAEEQRRGELEARVADYARAALELQEELLQSRERLSGTEQDVRAAEDTILRLEGELRARVTRIEELTQLNDDWRETLDSTRESIGERDALIRRLEAEAAHSTALLDNLQQSMRSLEASPASAEEAAAPSATRLLIRTEGETEVVHVLGRRTSIGRTPDNDVQIDTKFVSRHHAVILAGHVHTIIEDLGSTNGVLVNGQRVTRQNLADGDAVVVGNAQFRFAVRAPSAERPA